MMRWVGHLQNLTDMTIHNIASYVFTLCSVMSVINTTRPDNGYRRLLPEQKPPLPDSRIN